MMFVRSAFILCLKFRIEKKNILSSRVNNYIIKRLRLVAVPEGTACRQIIDISYIATHTRKSLVKGERFIRSVWMGEMMTRT